MGTYQNSYNLQNSILIPTIKKRDLSKVDKATSNELKEEVSKDKVRQKEHIANYIHFLTKSNI